jgi:hypothetical protein
MSEVRNVRAISFVVVSTALVISLVACGHDSDKTAPPSESTVRAPPVSEHFVLPFDLVQLDGTVPIGRPVVYDHEPYTFDIVPVGIRSLRAAYRVTDDEPIGLFREWVGQLDGLALDDLSVHAGTGPGEP